MWITETAKKYGWRKTLKVIPLMLILVVFQWWDKWFSLRK